MNTENSLPLTPEDALDRARQQTSAFCKRTYSAEDATPVFSPLDDFTFFVMDDEGPCIQCYKRGMLWARMGADVRCRPPNILIRGQTIRIDAVGVMLSYLAIRHAVPLSYELPILKQTLSADQHGALSLNG